MQSSSPYDAIADRYDELFEGNLFYDFATKQEEVVLTRFVQATDSSQLALDIGCGTGVYTRWLDKMGYDALGIDISRKMCEVAAARAKGTNSGARFLRHDAGAIDQLDRKFDIVVCLGSTLNHINDWEELFRQVSVVLSPDGRFIFSCDNFFGVDSFFWLFKRSHTGYAPETRFQRFRENLYCLVQQATFHNDWDMHTPVGQLQVPLYYETGKNIQRYLNKHGFDLLHTTGANLLTCFVPAILNASVELGSQAVRLGVVGRSLSKLDDKVAASVAPGLAAIRVMVAAPHH